MKTNIFRKGIAAILVLVMLGTVAFGATISSIKYKKGTVTIEYYVGGDDATIWVYDAANPDDVIYVDQEDADGSFSFGLPEEFEGEMITARVGGVNEPVAEETVSVTPTPAPTPDPESVEAGGIYGYVNKEDFTDVTIDYTEKYMVTEADFKEEPNAAAYAKGDTAMLVYDEYAGAEGVFYVEGHALANESISYYFDPIKTGKAKISIKFMYDKFPQAGSDGEVPFFSILDGTTDTYAIRNCSAQYTYTGKVPVAGMYFYNGASDYTRYRNYGTDASWNTLTYIIDMDTKTFDLDYNGTLFEDNAFYGDVTELSKIYFHGSRTAWGSNYYIDEIKVMAEEAEEYDSHTVTFYNDDTTTVIDTKSVKDGRRMIPAEAPSRRGYTFVGWYNADQTAADFSSITEDMSVYAKYLPKCTVDFYDETREELLTSITVDYAAEAKIADPVKEGYTFMGWVNAEGELVDLSSVTENLTVYEWFEEKSTIYFYDLDAQGNATLLSSQTIDYGAAATPLGNPGTRTDAEFIGWGWADGKLADFSSICGNKKVYAIYGTKTTYKENFEGITIAESGAISTTSANAFSSMSFPASGNNNGTTLGAILEANTDYSIYYNTGGNNLSGPATINNSSDVLYVDRDQSNGAALFSFPEVSTGKVTVSYDVNYLDWGKEDGAVLRNVGGLVNSSKTAAVRVSTASYTVNTSVIGVTYPNGLYAYDGQTANTTKMASTLNTWNSVSYTVDIDNKQYTYTINGTTYGPYSFYSNVDSVSGVYFEGNRVGWHGIYLLDNLTVDVYKSNGVTVAPTYYTVKFLSEDGQDVLDTQTVIEGGAAVYAGETPTKAPTAEIQYDFKGWSSDVSSVVADMDVTAVFVPSARKYNVTFVVGSENYVVPTEYGQAAVAPANPTKPADAQYTYTFTGWDKTFDNITSDLVVTAQFDNQLRSYAVTFYDEDKQTVLKSETIPYGSSATAPDTPTKEGDGSVSYEFKGWVDANGDVIDFSNITGETKIYASYEATYTTKTIKFLWGDVNGDGGVTIADSMAIVGGLTGGTKIYGDYTIGTVFANGLLWGDVNGDGGVTIADSMAIVGGLTGGTKTYGSYTIGVEASFEVPVE